MGNVMAMIGQPRILRPEAVKKAAELRKKLKQKAKTQGEAPATQTRTILIAAGRSNELLNECAEVLRGQLYLRGGLAWLLTTSGKDNDEEEPTRGIDYPPGTLVLLQPSPYLVAKHLNSVATFIKRDEEGTPHRIDCPFELAKTLIATARELPLRTCAGIAQVPLFLNGRIVAESGWNAETKLMLDIDSIPLVLEAPTKADAAAAQKRLLHPFRGWLDHGAVNEAALLAALLSAVLRPSLPTCPAILINGNVIGCGKGKMARAIAALACGGKPAIVTEGHDSVEFEKRIASAFISGAPVVLLDNLQQKVESSTLESALTEACATIRIMGSQQMPTLDINTLVLMTANNATMRADAMRRTLPVRIVVNNESAELAEFGFDPADEVLERRASLIADALTIVRAWWLVRADPINASHRKTLGSFDDWAKLVGGAVDWLVGISPIDLIVREKLGTEEQARDCDQIDALFKALRKAEEKNEEGELKFSASASAKTEFFFTSKKAVGLLAQSEWAEVLDGKTPTAQAVGLWLLKRCDRVLGDFVLRKEKTDSHTKAPVWVIFNEPRAKSDEPTRTEERNRGV